MIDQLLATLESSLSTARLQRYQSVGGASLETAVNYLWNMRLCESLYSSLNAVEIALRNGLHHSLTSHFGVPHWYDGQGILEPSQIQAVQQVKARILGRGDPVTPDRVVSELTFGFWVVILSRPYDARLWSANNAAPLKQAFLRLPKKQRQRQIIHQRYNAIRELRNRVMHHEPLFDDLMLRQRHKEIYQALHWLNPNLVDVIEWFDQFPEVYDNGRAQVEATLKVKLGIA